jgi:prophage regulatory protein
VKIRLMMTAEIARALGGVGRQYAYTLSQKKGFPDPVAELEAGRIWLAEDVEAWIAENRPDLTEGSEKH